MRRAAVCCTDQRLEGDHLLGERVNNRLKCKAAIRRFIHLNGTRRISVVVSNKIPAAAVRYFVVILFFRGFDKGSEELQRAIVVGQLILCRPFIKNVLEHFFPLIGS
ncbi:hypothetical protein D3C86_1489690 [compost metagenome]